MNHQNNSDYPGRIIGGEYSPGLQEHVSRYLTMYSAFDSHGAAIIPYIAAWHVAGRQVWYEYVGRHLLKIFKCTPADAAGASDRRRCGPQ